MGCIISRCFLPLVAAASLDVFRNEVCPETYTMAARSRVAVATMWIDEPRRRRLLPKSFRHTAIQRATAWACAARATTKLPLFILTANVHPTAQAKLCRAGLGVVDATRFDTARFFPAANSSSLVSSPQQRTDGWKTAYKFLFWNLTALERIVYYDLDVIVLGDPARLAARHPDRAFVASVECGNRGYVGLNSHLLLLEPSTAVFETLVRKAARGDYATVTNTEQDVLEAYWCPFISEWPETRHTLGVCAVAKLRFGHTFESTYADRSRPPIFVSAKSLATDVAPHVHDAYATAASCRAWVAHLADPPDGTGCNCLPSLPAKLYPPPRRRRLNVYGKCEALVQAKEQTILHR